MNMTTIFSQMAVLFIVLAVGYAANKFKILTADSNRLLSKLVVNIAMPCTILTSVLGGTVTASGLDAVYFLLVSFGSFVLVFILAAPLPKLLRTPKNDAGLYRFMIAFSNAGFMGFPIILSIFGTGAIFYVTLFNIVFSLLCFSIGLIMVSGKTDKINFRLFINPTMIVSLLAVLIFYTKPSVPVILSDSVQLIGQLTTPSAMLVIGSTLAGIPMKAVFKEWRIYPIVVIKLIAVPLITWLVFRLFIQDPLMLGVLVALTAMPTASNATMLTMEYGGNENLASKGVFVTTLFSVATIPLLISLLFS